MIKDLADDDDTAADDDDTFVEGARYPAEDDD